MRKRSDAERKAMFAKMNKDYHAMNPDLAHKARNTLADTPENREKWIKNSRRIDIKGIDTPTRKKTVKKEHTKEKKPKKITRKDGTIVETNEKGEVLIKSLNIEANEVASNFSRYNGGWFKKITGIDKTHTSGYSLKGEFLKDRPVWLKPGDLILDCSIAGSRKHQTKAYHLMQVQKDGTLKELYHDPPEYPYHNKEWAVNMWDVIEKHLKNKSKD
jgi:Zn-finger nucleic acid-binding protein